MCLLVISEAICLQCTGKRVVLELIYTMVVTSSGLRPWETLNICCKMTYLQSNDHGSLRVLRVRGPSVHQSLHKEEKPHLIYAERASKIKVEFCWSNPVSFLCLELGGEKDVHVFLEGSDGIESACNAGDPGWEDLTENRTARISSILAWRIPWTEEPGGLQSTRSQRVRHDWATNTHSPGRTQFYKITPRTISD